MKKSKPKVNTSLKIDVDVKQRFEDWLWLTRKSFGIEVENLIIQHLNANPLTPLQQKMVEEFHRLESTKSIKEEINGQVKKDLEQPKAKKKKS